MVTIPIFPNKPTAAERPLIQGHTIQFRHGQQHLCVAVHWQGAVSHVPGRDRGFFFPVCGIDLKKNGGAHHSCNIWIQCCISVHTKMHDCKPHPYIIMGWLVPSMDLWNIQVIWTQAHIRNAVSHLISSWCCCSWKVIFVLIIHIIQISNNSPAVYSCKIYVDHSRSLQWKIEKKTSDESHHPIFTVSEWFAYGYNPGHKR